MRREAGPGVDPSPYTGVGGAGRDQGGEPAIPSHAFLMHKGSADISGQLVRM